MVYPTRSSFLISPGPGRVTHGPSSKPALWEWRGKELRFIPPSLVKDRLIVKRIGVRDGSAHEPEGCRDHAGTRSALARMLPRDRGTVVQVGSTLAYRGIPLQSAYSGSKHALQGFHESLRTELLHDRSNVRVTMVQMPAANTPQFSRVLSRLPRQTQLVPQINQPEVAAKAILYAADHPRRREYWVGVSTVGTLVANAVAPGLVDRYLARTGFGSQQTKAPRRPDQPVNLWWPADGEDGQDFGAPGIFDSRARGRSAQLWASQHHDLLTAVAGLALGARYFLRRLAP